MKSKILVIGANGNVGGRVVEQLVERGVELKAGMRNIDKSKFSSSLVEVIEFDYERTETFADAIEGVKSVFMLSAPLDADAAVKIKPFIDYLNHSGVKRVVFLSSQGADKNDQMPLRQIELHLINQKMDYTLVRPNFFMENFSQGFILPMMQQTGGIFLPAEEGKSAFIASDDIARVIVESLLNENHIGKKYNLTGGESLSHSEVVKIISEKTGKKYIYQSIKEEEMVKTSLEQGMPQSVVDYMAALYQAVRNGYTDNVTDDYERIFSNKPIGFKEFVDKNINVWK